MNSNINFNKIIKTIDFFSQDLHQEQFIKYGLKYLHDLMQLETSYLYLQDNYSNKKSNFKLVNSVNSKREFKTVEFTDKLSRLATLHGRYLTSNFSKYFDDSFFEYSNINLVMPIINKSRLLGFIVSEGEKDFSDNMKYLNAINIILNMSLSKIINNELLTNQSDDLKAEIYNLNLLSHLTAQIISERNLENLYFLCIDSVRELTASAYTTLAFQDEITNNLTIKKSKDIVNSNEFYFDFETYDYNVKDLKHLYSISDDEEELRKIFINYDDFKKIEAEHIILMIDKEIKGFITISKAVNDKKCSPKILFKIKSIAYFIYISIMNAKYIDNIERKNNLIKKQIETLKRLNRSIENINSTESLSELIDVVMTTIKIEFNINKCIFLKKENENFKIMNHFGYKEPIKVNSCNLEKNFYYEFSTNNLDKYLITSENHSNCFISAPIVINDIFQDKIIGYIIITEAKDKLQEYQLTAIKAISNLISPVIKSFEKVENLKSKYIRNEKELFINKVKEYLEDKKNIELNFYINYKKLNSIPFKEENYDFIKDDFYIFDSHIFSLSYNKLSNDYYDKSFKINSLEELYDEFRK